MPTKDPRVDAYIEKSADFAKPILKKLRALVHKGCPEVTETIKWGMPAFDYKGGFCGMAAFKQHCSFGFWKAALLDDGKGSKTEDDKAMSWGARGSISIPAKITSLEDLPSDAKFLTLIKKAKKLNDDGVKVPKEKAAKKPLPMPSDFAAALKKTKGAIANFEKMSPSCKREYIEWVIEAKRDETRQNRIATAVEWIAEGKSRHWKYQKK
ncbi:MAG TPA: YdeI/OmpD-associated family protein [Phycisphaerales bacterium]|nr:YdeI/OmpD-associated family protein [Phycisphaerales bacterium]HRQ76068.1 YdeI/OmpD-associated family protein [Phycisphaerales bacterium]